MESGILTENGALNVKNRCGVIGLGQMGIQHAAILSVLTGHSVCAYDPNERLLGVAKKVAKNICAHSTLDDLLDQNDLSAVFLCTPVHTHASLVETVNERCSGELSVFVEKPLSIDCRSATELASLIFKSNRTGMVGFQKRFNGVYAKVKELLSRDLIGNVRFYRGHAFSYDVPRKEKGRKFEPPDGGVTLDFGAHVIDLLIWLFGEPQMNSSFKASVFSSGVEDYVHTVLNHRGLRGSVDIGWSMRNYAPNEHQIEIHGTLGTILADDDLLTLYLDKPGEGGLEEGFHSYSSFDLTKPVPYLFSSPEYVLEDQYFLECIRSGAQPHPSFSEAAKVNKLLDEIRSKSY